MHFRASSQYTVHNIYTFNLYLLIVYIFALQFKIKDYLTDFYLTLVYYRSDPLYLDNPLWPAGAPYPSLFPLVKINYHLTTTQLKQLTATLAQPGLLTFARNCSYTG